MTPPSSGAVVTVTVNPALDQTLWIPGFAVDAVNRVEREATRPGGKGVNVAARLAELGVRVTATGVLGTENASSFEALLADRGIEDRFVRRPGSTRTGIKIVDPTVDRTTDINFAGESPDAAALTRLEDQVNELAGVADWVVLAGSLPPNVPVDLYRRLIEVAHERGASVLLDTSGEPLRCALGARPDAIKPNEHELGELVGRSLDEPADVATAARELHVAGIGLVVVSMGSDGALFHDGDETIVVDALPVAVVSTVGAGDAMVAGVVAGLLAHRPLAAVATVAVACSATAIKSSDARLDRTTVEALAATVHISSTAVSSATQGES